MIGLLGVLVLGVLLVGALGSPSSPSSPSSPPPRPIDAGPQPIDLGEVWIVGDSYAVGIAAALRREGRRVRSDAKVGRTTLELAPLPARMQIVSIGTNDLAGTEPVDAIARRILARLWAPLADQTTRTVLVLPPETVRDARIAARARELRELLEPSLDGLPVRTLEVTQEPTAPDGLHFSPEAYGLIGFQAWELLAP